MSKTHELSERVIDTQVDAKSTVHCNDKSLCHFAKKMKLQRGGPFFGDEYILCESNAFT